MSKLQGGGAGSSPQQSVGGAGGPGRVVVTTRADETVEHLITEDDLVTMESGKRDHLAEFGWAMLAMAVGSVPAAVVELWKAYFVADSDGLGVLGLLQVVLLVVGGGFASFSAVVVRRRGRISGSRADEIRQRTRDRVKYEPTH